MIFNQHMSDGSYGMELLLDLYDCDKALVTREDLLDFVEKLVTIAEMEAEGSPIVWEDLESEDLHIRGVSVFQWIKTSNIVVHALSFTGLVMVNLFSCKSFEPEKVIDFARDFFSAQKLNSEVVRRGRV